MYSEVDSFSYFLFCRAELFLQLLLTPLDEGGDGGIEGRTTLTTQSFN